MASCSSVYMHHWPLYVSFYLWCVRHAVRHAGVTNMQSAGTLCKTRGGKHICGMNLCIADHNAGLAAE